MSRQTVTRAAATQRRGTLTSCRILLLLTVTVVWDAQACFTDSQRRLGAASRAYLSPVVASGHLLRKSPVFSNKFTATFRIARVYKSNGVRLKKRSEVVLQFWNYRRIPRAQSCSAAAKNLTTGKKYFIFAELRTWDRSHALSRSNSSSDGRALVLSAFNSPVKATNKNRKAVKGILCRKCARKPGATGLKDKMVRVSDRLRLKCKVRGNPPPLVAWFKDGIPIRPSRRLRIRNKKKSSRLTIRRVKSEDDGKYECRARNIVSKWPAVHSARITVIDNKNSATSSPRARPTNESSIWKFVGLPCPLVSFCLNGGTCRLFEEVGEFVCQCADGYKGPRCENKDLSADTTV